MQGNLNLAVLHIRQSLGRVEADKDKIITDFINNTGPINNAAEFYNNLGVRFTKNNQWPEAISAFGCALELRPDSADYYYNLALVYLNIGDKIKARMLLRQVLKIDPNYSRAKSLITRDSG